MAEEFELPVHGKIEKSNPNTVPTDQKECQKKVYNKHAPGKTAKSHCEEQQNGNNGRGSETGLDQADQIMDAGIAPHAFVQVEKEKARQFQRNNPYNGLLEIC